jgi:hypothetical protein
MFPVPILKFTPEGNFLNEYESVTDAANSNNITRSSIIRCASGDRKTGGGFKWRYVHEISREEYLQITRNF